MADNKRKFSRSRLAVQVEVERPNGEVIRGKLRDVSMNGLYVLCEKKLLHAGEECMLRIVLEGADPPIRIQATGAILRTDETGAAVQFTGIDVDSFQHMTRLVMYNAEEPDRVEQEFAEHSGIYPRV